MFPGAAGLPARWGNPTASSRPATTAGETKGTSVYRIDGKHGNLLVVICKKSSQRDMKMAGHRLHFPGVSSNNLHITPD